MENLPLSAVTVVSVCYKSDEIVTDMMASIPAEVPVVLVDNGKSNKFERLAARRNITIVSLEENVGFGRGCNAGADVAETPWVLFLNPDARLQQGAITALLDAVKKYPKAVAFNPRISNADGSQYFKRRSWLLPKRMHMARGWPKTDQLVPILSGAALFVNRDQFLSVGGFDPRIFLYHEDDDLSIRLANLGNLVFVHGSRIVHAAGHSSVRSPEIAYLKAFHMAQSRIYTGIKHGRHFPRGSTLLQAVALFLSPAIIFSPRRRAKAAGFLAGCISSKL